MEEFPLREDKGEGEEDASLRGRVATAVLRASRELSPDLKARLVDEAQARKAEVDEDREAREKEQRETFKKSAYVSRRQALDIMKRMTLGPYDYDLVRSVADKLGQFEAAVSRPSEDLKEVTRGFAKWRDGEGESAWERFRALRAELLDRERRERELEEAERRRGNRDACRQAAISAAIELRDANPQGPNARVGTVCAGLAHISGVVWRGTSGAPLSDLHPVMGTLLSGVVQIEKWPVGACGEVHAMNQYLTAQSIDKVSDIKGEDLFSHAETWNDVERKWQGRAACKNCSQWMDKVKINRA